MAVVTFTVTNCVRRVWRYEPIPCFLSEPDATVFLIFKTVKLVGTVCCSHCRNFSKFWLRFTMVVYETIYFEAHTNDWYIWHINNIVQLYFIIGRAEQHWKFSSWHRDAPDIYRFPIVHMVKTHFLLEYLSISWASLGILEKIKHSSVIIFVSNALVNCVCFKIYFLIDHHCKTPRKDKNLLNFLQGVVANIMLTVTKYTFISVALKASWSLCIYKFIQKIILT